MKKKKNQKRKPQKFWPVSGLKPVLESHGCWDKRLRTYLQSAALWGNTTVGNKARENASESDMRARRYGPAESVVK